jgi:hypothetical protein
VSGSPGFLRRVGKAFRPLPEAIGPWGPGTMSGMVVAGLVAQVAEQAAGTDGFDGVRLTADLVRMATLDEICGTARLLRDGRRLRLVDVTVDQNGREVAHGRAVFVRRSATPPGEVWSDSLRMPAPPVDESWVFGPRAVTEDGLIAADSFDLWGDPTRRKYMWFRLGRELIEGEPTSGFVRAACVADATNPLTNWGSAGLEFVNSDVSLTLARAPEGAVIGLAGRDRQVHEGVSVGTATMHDRHGPIGACVVTALASEVPMQLPTR